jgi:hypothetical protein
MPTPIKITIGDVTVKGELFDTPCARAIANLLPIETRPNEWGDEFYFSIPVIASLDETATDKVRVGDIGYWPLENALAIFFGKTPMSKGPEPVPASPVNYVGRILGDATTLKEAKGSFKITIERLDK